MSNATSNDQQVDIVQYVLKIDPTLERVTTIFPAGATIEADGSLRLKEGGRVGGVIKGNVYSESGTLVIDQNAIIEGSVFAKGRCLIFGQVGLPNRKAVIRCEMEDGLLVSHIAQLHADIQHNGISSTNVSGQIRRISEADMQAGQSAPQQSAETWQPPGQHPQRDQVPQQPPVPGAPLALANNPSPVANFNNPVPLRIVIPAENEQGPAQQTHGHQDGYAAGNGVRYTS
ncbi:polymer-forming cytoskeletal protein [Burkholderia cenocepacia]|uniref:polymer-forming cytoskeletal protein n=1 Tax=Burkholderia cenocepacia TaxID=95486 RepID=UPI001B9DEB1C|nr:polymer-forming cytoskeletal protein [Burkholderia cenocepacia]MBR8028591.1 polymer-forming cytoskeletal protein [Burkholderia cenocepacia]MBR8173894.1 polymer-forming cytoskeletal protein [Burkholderia cenocepacia]